MVLAGLRGARHDRSGRSGDAKLSVSNEFGHDTRCPAHCLCAPGRVCRSRLLWPAHGGCASLAAIGTVASASLREQPFVHQLLWSRAQPGFASTRNLHLQWASRGTYIGTQPMKGAQQPGTPSRLLGAVSMRRPRGWGAGRVLLREWRRQRSAPCGRAPLYSRTDSIHRRVLIVRRFG